MAGSVSDKANQVIRVIGVIARLSILSYQVIWVILSSYRPNKHKLR
jgi:hypothetical protein